jgi:hypothetical protein
MLVVSGYLSMLFVFGYGLIFSAYSIISEEPLPTGGLFVLQRIPVTLSMIALLLSAISLPYAILVGVRVLSVNVNGLGYDNINRGLFTENLLWAIISTTMLSVFLIYGSILFGTLFLLPGVIFYSVFCLTIYDATISGFSTTRAIRRVWIMTKDKKLDMFAVFTPVLVLVVVGPIISSTLVAFILPSLVGYVFYMISLSFVVVFGGYIGAEVYVLLSGFAPTDLDPILPEWVKLINPFNWKPTRYGDDWSKFR